MKYKYLKNGSSLQIYSKKCTGCGMCIEVCPHNVFKIVNKKVTIIDRDACMECGACATNCSFSAIAVQRGTGGVMPVLEEMMNKNKPVGIN